MGLASFDSETTLSEGGVMRWLYEVRRGRTKQTLHKTREYAPPSDMSCIVGHNLDLTTRLWSTTLVHSYCTKPHYGPKCSFIPGLGRCISRGSSRTPSDSRLCERSLHSCGSWKYTGGCDKVHVRPLIIILIYHPSRLPARALLVPLRPT